jgi:hypothetical protein
MSQMLYPAKNELGTFKSTYANNPAHAMNLLGFVVLCLLAAAALLVMWRVQRSFPDRLILASGSVLMVIAAAGLLLVIVGRLNISAAVYEHGFILTNQWRQQAPCRWEDVTEVYETVIYRDHEKRYPQYWRYTVLRKDGRPIRLDNAINHNRKLGMLIQKQVHRRLLPQLTRAYEAGETVAFGHRIALNQRGIVCAGELLPWDRVTEITYSRQRDLHLSIRAGHRPSRRVPHKDIANYDTLKAMVRKALDLRSSSTRPIIHDERQPKPSAVIPASEISPNSIAGLSMRLGCDVRDLFIEGYSLKDVQGVLQGDYTLEEVRQRKPGRWARWKRKI